jgi:hypothetical protein
MKKVGLLVAGLAVLLAVHCTVDAQSTRPGKGARLGKGVQAKKSAGGKHFARPKRIFQPKGIKGFQLVAGTQLVYPGTAVNFEDGTTLLDFNNQPISASQIRVWAPRVTWRDSFGRSVTTPTGFGGSAPSTYRYPGFNVDGIVINQPGGITENVTASDQGSAQTFQISNGAGLVTNVNAPRGTYGSNGGSYDLIIEIVQP